MQLFKQANQAYLNKDYLEAYIIYRQIAILFADPSIVAFNLELCKQQLSTQVDFRVLDHQAKERADNYSLQTRKQTPSTQDKRTWSDSTVANSIQNSTNIEKNYAHTAKVSPSTALQYYSNNHKEQLEPTKNHLPALTTYYPYQAKNYKGQEIVTIQDLYQEVASVPIDPTLVPKQLPLVSVIMTCHNTAAYIEAAINSLILQSYPNLEIIVVDDYSTDNTFSIVDRLSKANSKVKAYRLNTNLGTYFGKNYGISKAKGEIIFFHDSDDVCHFERIERCTRYLLSQPDAIAVRCAYSRVTPEKLEVIRVDGFTAKLGLITLGVRKKVFNEVGYFNMTTRASDDEFFHRLNKYYGRQRILNLGLPLYYNTMRQDSLFTDMVQWQGVNSIKQNLSQARYHYLQSFKEFHQQTPNHLFKELFTFPRCNDVFPLQQGMSKLANPKIPVYVNICSIPSREKQLEKVVATLASQVDHLHFYLDGYKNIPSYIQELGDKATVVLVRNKQESIRDNGKFILLEQLIKQQVDAYYFTCDDDINYPTDYINTMLHQLQSYQDKAVVGVHGVIIPSRSERYFSKDRIVYNFTKGLEKNTAVNILGTGTIAFRTSQCKSFNLHSFTYPGMVDIYFAIYCRQQGLVQICIQRFNEWLTEDNQGSETLFTEFKQTDHKQTQLIKDNLPWGYTAIRELIPQEDFWQELVPELYFFNP